MDIRDLVVSTTTIIPQATTAVLAATNTQCQSLNLPSGGVLIIPGSDPITLTTAAAFRPLCVPTNAPNIIVGTGSGSNTGVVDSTEHSETETVSLEETSKTPQYSDFRDPFYASTFPQCYALAATTIVAYTLVIMLFITPRSFLDGGVVVLGRRGFTNGGSGGKNIGGRPWLQKVAALTVAISMTIATANTFRVAQNQYSWGIQNAKDMQDEVLDGTELKVIRIISDSFLWLAQAQTLIRLFPRQREKVIIKWTAFSLVVLDIIFESLNQFRYSSSAGHTFTDAVPALSYLFQLSLGVLYAAWVIYYSLMKKRYAFYHPRMRNICLVAVLSLLAILVPVVFFVLDISKREFTGWGDYVRWVGAAAASVIVWEWVERIEALEREEKKDGILGREVFDGDEMIDMMPPDSVWPRRRRKGGSESKDDDESVNSSRPKRPQNGPNGGGHTSRLWPAAVTTFAERYRFRSHRLGDKPAQRIQAPACGGGDSDAVGRGNENGSDGGHPAGPRRMQPPLWPVRPPPAVTPISRTDTASADSTVYVMRYHPLTDSAASHTTDEPSSTPGNSGGNAALVEDAQFAQPDAPNLSRSNSASPSVSSSHGHGHGQGPRTTISFASSHSGSVNGRASAQRAHAETPTDTLSETATTAGASTSRRWRTLTHTLPFRRGGGGASVSAGSEQSAASSARPGNAEIADERGMQHDDNGRWDIRARFEDFAATQAERIRERIRPSLDTTGLPVMVIPAPQRQGAALAQVLEEEENQYQPQQWPHSAAPLQRSSSSTGTGPGSPGIVMMGNLVNASGPSSPMWRSNSNASVSSSSNPRSGAAISAGPPLRSGLPAGVVADRYRVTSPRGSGSPEFEGGLAQTFSPVPSQVARDKQPAVASPPDDNGWAGPSQRSAGPAP